MGEYGEDFVKVIKFLKLWVAKTQSITKSGKMKTRTHKLWLGSDYVSIVVVIIAHEDYDSPQYK